MNADLMLERLAKTHALTRTATSRVAAGLDSRWPVMGRHAQVCVRIFGCVKYPI